MALRFKLALVVLAAMASIPGSAAEFHGSQRVMGILLSHLDKAQAALDRGDAESALAYSQSVLMDRQERVYLDTGSAGHGIAPTAEQAFRDAQQIWLDSLPSAMNLVFVDNESDADLVVRFNPSVVSEGLNVAGNIQWWRSVNTECDGKMRASVKAVIQVRTERPGSNQAMSYELLRHTCAHELGHFIGMSDSYRVGDLMGPMDLNAPVSRMSDEELSAMSELRSRALKVRGYALFGAAAANIR